VIFFVERNVQKLLKSCAEFSPFQALTRPRVFNREFHRVKGCYLNRQAVDNSFYRLRSMWKKWKVKSIEMWKEWNNFSYSQLFTVENVDCFKPMSLHSDLTLTT